MMEYNQDFIDKIQSAQSSDELYGTLARHAENSFLKWRVKPKMLSEAKEHFITINDLEEQKQCLADLLDKNQLYVHLSEIEDKTFNVSEADKILNKKFYKGGDDV